MSSLIISDDLFQRSRARVKGLGEVFTPEAYVEDMLKIISQDRRNFWSDDNITFFEPSCGHGNIVLAIYRKRLEAIYKKALSNNPKEAALYSVANALNTLWAIDVETKNINQCRGRVLIITLDFIREKTQASNNLSILKNNLNFMAHVICSIAWHIHENDTLSSLSSVSEAQRNGSKTRTGGKWLSQNGHKEMNFENTWVAHFENCEEKGVAPIQFERAVKFIKNLSIGSTREVAGLEFAQVLVSDIKSNERSSVSHGELVAEL